jgi:uncharacterized protein (DUF488 family)
MENEVLPPAGVLALSDRLFTVGHSNHEPEVFLRLLESAGVTAVTDVRSSPYSRRLPHFNRQTLEALLHHHRIAYVFLGDHLGGRPASAELYDAEGWASYEAIRRTAAFEEGLTRLLRGLEHYRIALLCGEEDPLDCHRGLMIAPALKERGVLPRHIRKDGRLETMAQFEARLQDETGLGGLFGLDEAYWVMNRKKAFRLARETEDGE